MKKIILFDEILNYPFLEAFKTFAKRTVTSFYCIASNGFRFQCQFGLLLKGILIWIEGNKTPY